MAAEPPCRNHLLTAFIHVAKFYSYYPTNIAKNRKDNRKSIASQGWQTKNPMGCIGFKPIL